MQGGGLRHRITILKPAYGEADAYNVKQPEYIPDGDIWGSVEALSGNELIAAQQIVGEVTSRVRVRFESAKAITPKHKLRLLAHGEYAERTLDVAAPPFDEEGRRRELVILCSEPVPTIAEQQGGPLA